MTINEAISTRMNQLLSERSWGITEFSRISGIPFETLRSIYKGKAKGIHLKTVLLLARGFGVTASDF